ncbi:MAG: thioredoxin-like domain-containing protein [Bacteroidales bacterium]|nr:thioredoxin-like domain-containing protein [Bacteroidales bacterium]
MKNRRSLIICSFVFASFFRPAYSQEGYHFSFSVRDLTDTVCYLVEYTGDKTYLIDTALVRNGSFIFEGKTHLEKGMYLVVGQSKNKYLDFLVNDASRIRIETDTAHWIDRVSVRGSKENQLFFDYVAYLAQKRKAMDSLSASIRNDSADEEHRTEIREKIRRIDEEVVSHQKGLIRQYHDTFFGTFLLASMEPEISQDLQQETESSERDRLLREYRDHYWDNFDLTDDRLLHTPLFHPRMERYMDDLTYPLPDSISRAIDLILFRVSSSKKVYEYLLWYFLVKYERSTIMGYDAVFVHIVNNYFKTGKAGFVSDAVIQNVIRRSDVLEPLLIGKPAPLMILLDTNDIPVSLYSVESEYTVVYFWDSDCSFCTKESPRLKQFYDASRDAYDMEVYAVCIDTSMTEWKKYIRQNHLTWINVNGYLSLTPDFHDLYDVHSSPVMYLLDRKKTIIGKRILTEGITEIIDRKEKEKKNSN